MHSRVAAVDRPDRVGQLMHAENVGRTDFGVGDRAGLEILGQGRC